MKSFLWLFLAATVAVRAQVPGFGGCPNYDPMPDFQRERFLGEWYETERYFTVNEVASKCVSAMYERRPDGKIWVNNAYTNRLTNVQRIISGVIQPTLKGTESTLQVKYQSFPVNYETALQVLDTDYDTYAVVWSCSRIGPVAHTENAWVMTRERVPPGPVLQRAYGILDKYRISRTFFVQTDQTGCQTTAPQEEALGVIDETQKKKKKKPVGNDSQSTNEEEEDVPEDQLVREEEKTTKKPNRGTKIPPKKDNVTPEA